MGYLLFYVKYFHAYHFIEHLLSVLEVVICHSR
ncbi:hypothetical protein KM1_213910, partial [Entamoeba histolytica HM-3:IMSS]